MIYRRVMRSKNTFKILFDIVLAFIIVLLLAYNRLIIYGLKMGKGQLSIVLNSRAINDCLNDSTFPDSLKNKLILIQEIRQYAIDSLGLVNSPNYNSVYNQQHKPAIWVLTAAEPFSLNAIEWKFPIVGLVPYKGFFDKDEAKVEQYKLLQKGFDTKLGTTSGWSTLGWFEDPILSNMLYQTPGELSNLIIHELTHATIFIKNDVQTNENLASFIGDMGAMKFLTYKFGVQSKEYIEYVNEQQDELTYNNYILHEMSRLDSLYKKFNSTTGIVEKKKKKTAIITAIVTGVSQLKLHNKLKYIRISKRAITCKNAFFMEFVRYDSERNKYAVELKNSFDGDIVNFIKHRKSR